MDTNLGDPNPQVAGAQPTPPTQDKVDAPASVFLRRNEEVVIPFHGFEFKARKLAIADTDLIKMRVLRSQIGPFRAYLMAFHKAIENNYPDIRLTDILEDTTITEDEIQDLIINQMPKIGFSLGAKKKEMNPPTNDTQGSPDSTSTTPSSSDIQDIA